MVMEKNVRGGYRLESIFLNYQEALNRKAMIDGIVIQAGAAHFRMDAEVIG